MRGTYQAQVIVTKYISHVENIFFGIFDRTHGQLGSTNSAGDDSTMVKNVQSTGKILMMNGEEMGVEGEFMLNALGI